MSDVIPEWYQFRNALLQADFLTAAKLLETDPCLIDCRNGIGETVLHFLAVENNQAALVAEVYASPAFREKQFKDASYVAGLLVVTKFQDLIRRAAPIMEELHFPLLATAHDYYFIYEAPRNVQR